MANGHKTINRRSRIADCQRRDFHQKSSSWSESDVKCQPQVVGCTNGIINLKIRSNHRTQSVAVDVWFTHFSVDTPIISSVISSTDSRWDMALAIYLNLIACFSNLSFHWDFDAMPRFNRPGEPRQRDNSTIRQVTCINSSILWLITATEQVIWVCQVCKWQIWLAGNSFAGRLAKCARSICCNPINIDFDTSVFKVMLTVHRTNTPHMGHFSNQTRRFQGNTARSVCHRAKYHEGLFVLRCALIEIDKIHVPDIAGRAHYMFAKQCQRFFGRRVDYFIISKLIVAWFMRTNIVQRID